MSFFPVHFFASIAAVLPELAVVAFDDVLYAAKASKAAFANYAKRRVAVWCTRLHALCRDGPSKDDSRFCYVNN
jgi:hypothetical protein